MTTDRFVQIGSRSVIQMRKALNKLPFLTTGTWTLFHVPFLYMDLCSVHRMLWAAAYRISA